LDWIFVYVSSIALGVMCVSGPSVRPYVSLPLL
jgi:hypothetical protein